MSRRQKRDLLRIAVAAVLFLAGLLVPDKTVRLILFLLAYLTVGLDVLKEAGEGIVHGQLFDENFLMSIATLGAMVVGEYPEAVAAFGDNRLRLAWTRRLLDAGYRVPSVVHPTAIVSPSAVLGPGCLVLHGAIINTNTVLGAACLVNSGALVDHDNVLEDGVHVNLHATIKAWCHMEPCARTEAATVLYSTRRHIDGVEDHNLEDALFAFKLGETASYVKPFGAGHINDTYAVYMAA